MTMAELAAQASSRLTTELAEPLAIVAYVFAGLGISLVVVSAFVRTMIPLRWLAVGSNVGFLVYGALHPSVIPFLIAATLLPINLYRTREMIRLTRRVTKAAASSDLSGLWLKPYMKAKRFKAGTTLFHKGDLAEHLYLLADGMAALAQAHRRAVARLGDEIGQQLQALQRGEGARCAGTSANAVN